MGVTKNYLKNYNDKELGKFISSVEQKVSERDYIIGSRFIHLYPGFLLSIVRHPMT